MTRDKELFKSLQGFGLLTTKQIASNFFPGIAHTTVLRRLRKLEDSSYIRRIEGLSNYERAWALTQPGADLVCVPSPKSYFRKDQLEHDLKLSELRLTLESIGIAQSWVPEHEIRAKVCASNGSSRGQYMLIPDGIVGVEHNGTKESLALELELNYKSSKRYERIFSSYARKQSLLGVWYFVADKGLGKSISKAANKYFSGNIKTKFFWSLIDEVIQDPHNAIVHYKNDQLKLKALFKATESKKPAHLLAQGVSM